MVSEGTQGAIVVVGMADPCLGAIPAVIHSSFVIRQHQDGRASCVTAGGSVLHLLNIQVPNVIIQMSSQVIHFLF